MCQDCGCEQGNARAYFERSEHGHSHGHSHEHSHAHGQVHGSVAEIHIHVHLPAGMVGAGATVHSHVHGGANDPSHAHEHDPSHAHEHGDDVHVHEQTPHSGSTRTIEIESKVLARNDEKAAKNRDWLAERGVFAVNIISSPGSGKTYLLERTLEALKGVVPCAVIVGDQQTDNDAQRLKSKGAPVIQIETKSSCHLNAEQVASVLETVVKDQVKLLFIENVGNLVCPAAFDLGEQIKIALLSVTEGEDKPVKYPVLFNDAPVTVVTKMDLIPHLDVSIEKVRESIGKVNSKAKVFELSAKTGEGMDAWLEFLKTMVLKA